MPEQARTTSAGRWLGVVAAHAAAFALGIAIACADDDVLKFTHQGVERTAVLHQSVGATSPRPLVLALHGLGGTGANFQRFAQLDAAADREGFITVYPDAIEGSWSYGRPINQPMPAINGETVDDVGFLRLLIDDLVNRKIADPARIYVTGISRGGLMAFTLACALADRVAGAAPLITGMTDHQREDCRPSRPVPIMVIAGTGDRMQSFGGGQGPNGSLLSIPETMDFWRALHGCTRRDGRPLPHLDPADQTKVMLIEWSGCKTGTNPQLYRIEGGGHQIPSTNKTGNPMSEERFGLRNRDIETAEAVWAFFKNLSR